ncbi:MAG: Core-binding protein [Candidatus Poribacteria bacterium]|nr:Core-binding protein [Candidatus Poribacteria bacterium]
MSDKATLEEAERIAIQLLPNEQLKLIVKIGENLNGLMYQQINENQQHEEYLARVEAFLKLRDELSVKSLCKVDSVEDIRQIREERS